MPQQHRTSIAELCANILSSLLDRVNSEEAAIKSRSKVDLWGCEHLPPRLTPARPEQRSAGKTLGARGFFTLWDGMLPLWVAGNDSDEQNSEGTMGVLLLSTRGERLQLRVSGSLR